MSLSPTEEIVEEIRRGRMVVMMDDEDRENEGDLIMAAVHVRPEDINFMAHYGRGLICLTLTQERCRQLQLPLMVGDTDDKHGTNFTVSIEAAQGVTTGISAADRARTIQVAVRPDARPSDIVSPGHVFPLMAQPGGVLTRAGHTETGCDLARLAGLERAATIVEILNEDGSMARRPDLERFTAEHGLKLGTVADLIRYRMANEKTVERATETTAQTEYGEFRVVAYEDIVDRTVHLALVRGSPDPDRPTLVRVHVQNTLADFLAVRDDAFGWPLRSAMRRVAEEGEGIVVVLRKPESPQDFLSRLGQLHLPQGGDSPGGSQVLRTYGIGAQILKDLGVQRMRVLSAPKRMHGLSGFGLEVTEYVDCD
ncbi:MAG TPA: bifunctional 3,4-dihydroxy-2-butanone-4-phosphate synthase/GTP cyclohydrolase II [Gammaproteobacteria bacterium]|nr:bifunctional 3,4-dihydroxy-2-butanone-4-phosphate synthase/GTP cyclohydrolase II [Gammaproteobacteria bacterium]